MGAHFSEVGIVADMVTDTVFVHIGEGLCFAGEAFRDFEGFEDRAGICFATAEVVDLALARSGDEGSHESGDIERVDVVADLFAFVTKDSVFAALEVAFHEIAEETMEFDARVVRAGQA
ncbi:MAG: hypothetical protein RL630_2363, partial [Verrucomicrobiota bacterium]